MLTNKTLSKVQSFIQIDALRLPLTLVSTKSFLIENQIRNLTRKVETVDPKLEEAAFATFSEYNIRGRTFKINPRDLINECIVETVRFKLEISLRKLERSTDEYLDLLACDGYFGPGSSCGTQKPLAFKAFGGPLTLSCGDLIVPYKRQMSRRGLAMAEYERQRNHGITYLQGGTASFVPKDTTKYRMVCTEPSLDMFFQLGLKEHLNKCLLDDFGIDIPLQEALNQKAALVGSLSGTYATIDSTSASDTMYLDAYEEAKIFPQWFFAVLRTIKSRFMKYKGKTIKLSMIGTQGCGYTFSLMTMVLAAIVESVYEVMDLPNLVPSGVYGDDVVLDSRCYDRMISVMEDFGFVPNKNKSYSVGPFRESCGGDYHSGYNVRSVYIKSWRTPQDVCIAFNKLLDLCVYHDIYLWETLKYLHALAKSLNIPEVPLGMQIDSGIRMYGVRNAFKYFYPKQVLVNLPDVHTSARLRLYIGGYTVGHDHVSFREDTPTRYMIREFHDVPSALWDLPWWHSKECEVTRMRKTAMRIAIFLNSSL